MECERFLCEWRWVDTLNTLGSDRRGEPQEERISLFGLFSSHPSAITTTYTSKDYPFPLGKVEETTRGDYNHTNFTESVEVTDE